jgi:hypothetical protein
VFLFNILLLTAVVTRGSATMYYVNYVLLRPELVFAFIVSGMVASLSGALLSERLLGNLTACAPISGRLFPSSFRRADFLPAAFAGVADLWPQHRL